ncbi:MAG: glycosyltransferase family 9 protein [Bacteroidota bacterium]
MKVLLIRFSSIGDIVLTSPVLRSLKQARPEVEIHYLSKQGFKDLLIYNPYLSKLHFLDEEAKLPLQALKAEGFDYVIDLHKNLRSWRVKQALRCPSVSFDKQNLAKYKMVRSAKPPQQLPHIVNRYADCLAAFDVALDQKGLELFLPDGAEAAAQKRLNDWGHSHPLAIVLGATYATKRWPTAKFISLIQQYQQPVLLIGGPDAQEDAAEILQKVKTPVFDAVGKYSLLDSAALMKQASQVLAHDTGFMHIAAAFGQSVISLWGNTVPEMGMTPYKTPHQIVERKGLSCRPCSKIGYERCPKGHFKCMEEIKVETVKALLNDPSLPSVP